MQRIYYGAPGTGKSFEVDKILKEVNDENIFRVTFYPEYSYSDFVGQIKPKKTDSGFEYDIVEGVFLKALKKAYEDTSVDVYLIIEEVSRGRTTAIFGDIFQLLDRVKTGLFKGFSRYSINNDLISSRIPQIPSDKVKLPPRFHILGTLNTSDQSVYPIDTAFKRRFDWIYVDTKPKMDIDGNPINNFDISLKDIDGNSKVVKWCTFYQKINEFIVSKEYLELGEDKQLGQFFVETDSMSQVDFANKVLFYLWSDIASISYKNNVSLFSKKINSFSQLVDYYLSDKTVFSNEFLELLL